MIFIGICECCGKKREFEIEKLELREYDFCGCESKKECSHRWHDFVIGKEELFRKLYPELEYKFRGEKNAH